MTAEPPCQEGCGDIIVYVQVANEGAFIAADDQVVLSLYGVQGSTRTLIDARQVGLTIDPGMLTAAYKYELSGWDAYDSLVAVIDDVDQSPATDTWGLAKVAMKPTMRFRSPLMVCVRSRYPSVQVYREKLW